MRDTPKNFTNLVSNIKSDLICVFNNLHAIDCMIKVFAGNRPVPENPRIKELEKELQGENTCDLDALYHNGLASELLALKSAELCDRLQEAFGH